MSDNATGSRVRPRPQTPNPMKREPDFTYGVPGWLVGFIIGVFFGMFLIGMVTT